MKYFLFIPHKSGMVCNALYESLSRVRMSLEQLVNEESFDIDCEDVPSMADLQKFFACQDEYTVYLSNDTWFHIQSVSDTSILGLFRAETKEKVKL